MSLVPGLSPNIRLSEPEPGLQSAPMDVVVAEDDEQQDTPEYDDKGAILRIEHPDGSITVSLDGKPIDEAESRGPKGWFDNLAEDISDLELSRISSELLRGVAVRC